MRADPKFLYKPKLDCPFWDKDVNECAILKEPLCRTRGVCGFYPQTAEERKIKLREQRKKLEGENEAT